MLNNIPFTIEEKMVLRSLRIPKINMLREIEEEHIARSIKAAIETAYSLIRGKACYRTFRITRVVDDSVVIDESDQLFKGSNMVRLLGSCEYASLLVCTIGSDLPERVESLKINSLTDAYYLDRIGASMTDYMAEHVGRVIESEIIKHGYKPTFRYAAGYGNWDISVQSEIMRLTEAKRIGVTLTDTFIMVPRCSVSAVIGWERKNI